MPKSRLRIIVNFLLDTMADFSVQTRYAGELDYVRIRFSKLNERDLLALQEADPEAVITNINTVTNSGTPIYSHYIDLV